MGKYFRDEYLRDKKLRVLDFMPQPTMLMVLGKALMIITCFFRVDNKRENNMLENT